MRTVVGLEYFSLVDLRGVTRIAAVQTSAPDGEAYEIWRARPPGGNRSKRTAQAPADHEVLVEVPGLADPALILRVEIAARSGLGARRWQEGLEVVPLVACAL